MAKKPAKRKKESKRERSITRRIWAAIIIGGIASAIFGLVAVFWPGMTLTALVVLFGVFVLTTGLLWLFQGFTHIRFDPLWWLTVLFGAFAVGAGTFLLTNPGIAFKWFAILLAVFILSQSLWDLIIASYGSRRDSWIWVVMGIVGVVFGMIVLFSPIIATVAFVWVLGLYALIHGVTEVVFALCAKAKLKK